MTLVNPLRDVGPTHIHGLTDDDVTGAPMFREIVGDLLELLNGAVMVAHKVRFDQEFISTEFSAAGCSFPRSRACAPSSSPTTPARPTEPPSRRCCASLGVPYQATHSALGDDRAEAELLRRYLHRAEIAAPRLVAPERGIGSARTRWRIPPTTRPLTMEMTPHPKRTVSQKASALIASLHSSDTRLRTAQTYPQTLNRMG
jgi:DNA polymerase III epsilon subunit-like protein